MRRFTDREEVRIADEWRAGTSVADLLVKWQMSAKTLYDALRRQGVDIRTESRDPRWDEESIITALKRFEREFDRRPTTHELDHGQHLGHRYPTSTTIARHFGSFANACVVAFGEARSAGGHHVAKDDDTEEVIRLLDSGHSLAELGRARGISGQALGRRVRRYQTSFSLGVVKRHAGNPGQPRIR